MKRSAGSQSQGVGHPFYPVDLKLPNYVPNDKSVVELLGVFFGAIGVALIALWIFMSSRSQTKGKALLKVKISWFFMCGLIHFFLEGYFGVFHRTIPEGQSLLAQMWKEYGKGDSRYVIGDTFTVCMENITAFIDGPLAFLAVYAFLTRSSYRYIVQMVLSLCQLYGDVLYFSTEIFDGCIHGPVGHPLYFWFYFVCMNAFWIIIPFVCIVESWRHLNAAQSTADYRIETPAAQQSLKTDKKKK